MDTNTPIAEYTNKELDELTAPSQPEAMFSMIEAGKFLGVGTHKLLSLARQGLLVGATKEAGRTGNWSIPLSVLEDIKASGIIKARKPYTRKASLPITGRMTIKEASERFGIGLSTLQKKAQDGVLASTLVQTGPSMRKRFVDAEDVAALGLKPSNRGRYTRATRINTARLTEDLRIKAPVSDLTSELLRAADMVRDGKYKVSKLVLALEFVGGDE